MLAAAAWCPHLADMAGVDISDVPVIPVIGKLSDSFTLVSGPNLIILHLNELSHRCHVVNGVSRN